MPLAHLVSLNDPEYPLTESFATLVRSCVQPSRIFDFFCYQHCRRLFLYSGALSQPTHSNWRRYRLQAFQAHTSPQHSEPITGTLRAIETYQTSRQVGSGGGGEVGRRSRAIHGRTTEDSHQWRSIQVLCHGHHPSPITIQRLHRDCMKQGHMLRPTSPRETLPNALRPPLNNLRLRCLPLHP